MMGMFAEMIFRAGADPGRCGACPTARELRWTDSGLSTDGESTENPLMEGIGACQVMAYYFKRLSG